MIPRVTFAAAAFAPHAGAAVARVIAAQGATAQGASGTEAVTALIDDHLTVLVTLSDEPLTPATARTQGIRIGRALSVSGAYLDLPVAPTLLAWIAAGIVYGSHRPEFVGHDPDALPVLEHLAFATPDPEAAAEAWQALRPAVEGQAFARHLTDRPGNRLLPEDLAGIAEASESLGISVEVIRGSALSDAGLALLHAVGRGSAAAPCLVTMRWRGAPQTQDQDAVVLVGKGITFDSGGLCLKPARHMEAMKGDMAGAAAVLATIQAAAAAKLPLNVTGLLAIAENMPGSRALRPGDILHAHGGLTVEVIDTDAEGRLVLADALSWAISHERPVALIDLATLTGAMITTLGRHTGGLFGNADALAAGLIAAGQTVGEPLWRLPFRDIVDEDALRSDVADLRSCAPAGRLVPDARHAASFLSAFVPEDVAWAHLDIAGTSDDGDGHATGVGVLTLFEWLRSRPPASP